MASDAASASASAPAPAPAPSPYELPASERYAHRVFLDAVLPLVKVIKDDVPALDKGFAGLSGTVQVSVRMLDGSVTATHFVVEDGAVHVVRGVAPSRPGVELAFGSVQKFNAFFRGSMTALPRIRGVRSPRLLVAFFRVLLKLSALLGASDPPKDEGTKKLAVKCFYYLLSSGISQLNKAGHPEVTKWARTSPDRVYAWSVDGYPDVAAYIRVKAGKTKASRGAYQRAKPFFTMRFDNLDSALGILLEKDDLLESTAKEKLIMEGAPEFGAQIGAFMMLVGSLAK